MAKQKYTIVSGQMLYDSQMRGAGYVVEVDTDYAALLGTLSDDAGKVVLESFVEMEPVAPPVEPVVNPVEPEPIQLPPVIEPEPEPVPEPTPDGPTIPVETIVEVQPPIMTTTTTFSPRRGRR